jgi:hypothetical protein
VEETSNRSVVSLHHENVWPSVWRFRGPRARPVSGPVGNTVTFIPGRFLRFRACASGKILAGLVERFNSFRMNNFLSLLASPHVEDGAELGLDEKGNYIAFNFRCFASLRRVRLGSKSNARLRIAPGFNELTHVYFSKLVGLAAAKCPGHQRQDTRFET